jgi:hypothetical protein
MSHLIQPLFADQHPDMRAGKGILDQINDPDITVGEVGTITVETITRFLEDLNAVRPFPKPISIITAWCDAQAVIDSKGEGDPLPAMLYIKLLEPQRAIVIKNLAEGKTFSLRHEGYQVVSSIHLKP